MSQPPSEQEPVQQAPGENPRMARALRLMAIVRWALLGVVALVACTTWWLYVFRGEPTVAGPDKYYCPMHPEIRSPSPGTCPICFMNLEPIPEERKAGPKKEPGQPLPSQAPGEAPRGLSDVMLSVERREAVGITTTTAEKRTTARTLRLPAVIEAPEKATSEVRVRTPGFVERVAAVETGQRIEAGAPVVWVYSPEILRAEEELLAARRMVAPAAAAGAAPPPSGHELDAQMVDAARQRLILLGVHEVDVARIVESGKAERLIPVRAPAAGVVIERNVSVGTYATPEMMLFRVTDLLKLWATATVSAEDLTAITPGVKGRFVHRAGERSYEVSAALVEPEVSTATRAGRVRFVASNKDALLRPGDIGEVLVDLSERPYVFVPRDAVVDVGNARYVYVEKSQGTFSPQIVELGPLFGEERAITRGLEPGTRVVARGAFLLDSESRLGAALAPGAPSSTRETGPAPLHEHDHDHGSPQ